MNDQLAPDLDMADLSELRGCGLFLEELYLVAHPDVAAAGTDPLVHFLTVGCAAGRRPNPYFDPAWYLSVNGDVREAGQNPVLHYLRYGEREGRRPVPYFDPLWYAAAHGLGEADSPLRHFLAARHGGRVSPIPEFDAVWYTAAYSDVGAAGVDPFEHYLHQGYREDRNPSPGFDTRFYRDRYLAGAPQQNPLLHYLEHRHLGIVLPRRPEAEPSMAAAVRANVRPGPLFEAVRPLPETAERRAMVLAYYLPQFHAIPENDRWWGAGFTEWVNVGRGLPRFEGHYQPRMPRDLGHYDLLAPGVMRRQIDLARGAGLAGFVFYFYWFNGRRLLERPLEALLADRTLDFPFCLMWANENWTRRWDGSEDEVLISQDYRCEDEAEMAACFARHFADPRYIRLQGRPLLMMYRPRLVPDTAATVARWRALFRDAHGEDPIFVMSQSFNDSDPRRYGMDGAIEFPPHKLTADLSLQNQKYAYFDADFSAQVFAYDDVAAASLAEPVPDFPLIKTAAPSWDNDARRQGAGLVLHGATPAKYQTWLSALVERAHRHRFFGAALVGINAWNEWAEGAYLEPDQHYGAAFLNATGRAIAGLGGGGHGRLLLVGHDAFPAGAQQLLLQLGRQLRRAHGVEVAFLLLGGGRLEAAYGEVATTVVAAAGREAALQIARFRDQGFSAAIVNTAAAAPLAEELAQQGFEVTLLVHELPRILRERKLLEPAARGALAARRVVFPADFVRARFEDLAAVGTRAVVLPQGIYKPVAFSAGIRAARRSALGVAEAATLAVGVGYADLRKGFDLFLQVWRAAQRASPDMHFLWLGEIDAALHAYLAPEIDTAIATGRFHFTASWSDDVADWLSAADVFVLSSREDPLPSVVLEALSAGLPTVAFEATGGIPDIIARHAAGICVPLGDVSAMADAVAVLGAAATPDRRARLAASAQAHFAFDRYVAALLRLARPALLPVSVVVPSYNYARYLAQRLSSIFAQGYPVLEVIVLDDASTDDSVAVAHDSASDWGRAITLVTAEENSGSAFAQWRRAAALARGEWLWIAEADDACDPAFLESLAHAVARAPDAVLAFCDSRSVDSDGDPVWPSYQDYYAQSGAAALAEDGVFDAGDFLRRFLGERNLILNASAVLWRRAALQDALAAIGPELEEFRVAGDWRLYVELLAAAARSGGSVAFVAAALNMHRRHAASVTGLIDGASHVAEIERIHALVAGHCGNDRGLVARQHAYRATVAAQLGVAEERAAAPRRAARRRREPAPAT